MALIRDGVVLEHVPTSPSVALMKVRRSGCGSNAWAKCARSGQRHNSLLAGFGTFKRTETKPRKGRNPQTGEALNLPASARPAFTAGKAFKDNVKATYQK